MLHDLVRSHRTSGNMPDSLGLKTTKDWDKRSLARADHSASSARSPSTSTHAMGRPETASRPNDTRIAGGIRSSDNGIPWISASNRSTRPFKICCDVHLGSPHPRSTMACATCGASASVSSRRCRLGSRSSCPRAARPSNSGLDPGIFSASPSSSESAVKSCPRMRAFRPSTPTSSSSCACACLRISECVGRCTLSSPSRFATTRSASSSDGAPPLRNKRTAAAVSSSAEEDWCGTLPSNMRRV